MQDVSDEAVIRFEAQWFHHSGAKEQRIRDQFDLSATRFYQRVVQILTDPQRVAALPADLGATVNRLTRLIEQQERRRNSRHLAG